MDDRVGLCVWKAGIFWKLQKSAIGLCRLEDTACFRLRFCITSLLSLLTNLFSNLNT